MAHKIVVPRLGWTMEEGIFDSWLMADGDDVQEGDVIFVVEGDKATQEVESFDAGLLRISPDAPQPGDPVTVGTLLGYLVAPGETAPFGEEQPAAVAADVQQVDHVSQPRNAAPLPSSAPPLSPHSRRQGTPAISPRARRVAGELHVDWERLNGSGRTGRIIERDVRAAAETPTSEHRKTSVSGVRKTIAQRMSAAAQTTAAVTLMTKADATHLVTIREHRNSAGHKTVPSYTDLFLKLVAAALQAHPQLNALWKDDRIVLSDGIHIGVAVDTDDGLLVPVLRDAGDKSLRQIADETRTLAAAARARQLTAEQMQGGTFTVTNLGMYGIDAFTPIINLPQTAILGIGRIVAEPAVFEGQLAVRQMVSLSLTFDHRAIDGAPAARFLDTLRREIEQPFARFLGFD